MTSQAKFRIGQVIAQLYYKSSEVDTYSKVTDKSLGSDGVWCYLCEEGLMWIAENQCRALNKRECGR